jgi:DNA-binding MarR family transcriptional regulator
MDVNIKKIVEALTAKSSRGGPRSKLVDAIMVLLLSRPMRAAEIAEVFGLQSKYISSYLSYWRNRGFVEYDRGYWFLTPEGEEYARSVVERAKSVLSDEYKMLALDIVNQNNLKQTINDKKLASKPGQGSETLSFIVSKRFKANNKRQERLSAVICVENALKDEIDEEEFEVLSALLNHYARWGSTYIYIDQLQERLKADYTWLIRKVRSLQTKNLIYVYTDPKLGIRIGLSKRVKEMLETCKRS